MIQPQNTVSVYYLGRGYGVQNPNLTTELVAGSYPNARDLLEYRGEINRLVLDPEAPNATDLALNLRKRDISPENADIPIWLIASALPLGYNGIEGIKLIHPNNIGTGNLSNIVAKEFASLPR